MTVHEIGTLLEVNDETVRRWIRKGTLKAERDSKKEGNYIFIQDFIDFLSENPKYSAIYYAKKEIYKTNIPIVIDVHVKNLPDDVEVIVNLIRD